MGKIHFIIVDLISFLERWTVTRAVYLAGPPRPRPPRPAAPPSPRPPYQNLCPGKTDCFKTLKFHRFGKVCKSTLLCTVCPGSSDPSEKLFNIFASENEVYTIYQPLRYFGGILFVYRAKEF